MVDVKAPSAVNLLFTFFVTPDLGFVFVCFVEPVENLYFVVICHSHG